MHVQRSIWFLLCGPCGEGSAIRQTTGVKLRRSQWLLGTQAVGVGRGKHTTSRRSVVRMAENLGDRSEGHQMSERGIKNAPAKNENVVEWTRHK
jgi:hypothetical protein